MLAKIIAVLMASVVMWSFPPTHGWAIPFLMLALVVVVVIEGVRVVPQQNAWVIEPRLQSTREFAEALDYPRVLLWYDANAFNHHYDD